MPADNHHDNPTGGSLPGPENLSTRDIPTVRVGASSKVENDRWLPPQDGRPHPSAPDNMMKGYLTQSGFLTIPQVGLNTANIDEGAADRVVDIDRDRYGDIWDPGAAYRVVRGKGIDPDHDGDI